jgi:hypothetical protein
MEFHRLLVRRAIFLVHSIFVPKDVVVVRQIDHVLHRWTHLLVSVVTDSKIPFRSFCLNAGILLGPFAFRRAIILLLFEELLFEEEILLQLFQDVVVPLIRFLLGLGEECGQIVVIQYRIQ